MHNQTSWLDHVTQWPNRRRITTNADGSVEVVREQGTVIQQGTPQSATNFNNIENGVQAAQVALQVLLHYFLQFDRWVRLQVANILAEFLSEVRTVTLTNTQRFPFNSSIITLNLLTARRTLNYDIGWEIAAAAGNVGDIRVSDKQLNGFKVEYTGSATSVMLTLRIKGGMLI